MTKTKEKNNINEILAGLNKAQKEAVEYDLGPLLIIAGAGTGKTRVITRRIAYLIAAKKAKPSEILALTFTDKAATQMEERVDLLVPYGFNDVRISTFHAFGDRVLRENAIEIGLSPDFTVLNAQEAAVFFKDNLFSFKMDYFRPLGNPTQHIKAILSALSRAKDENISPKDFISYSENKLKSAKGPEEKEEAQKYLEIALVYEKYEELKKLNNYLDFGDQVILALNLFKEHPSILKKYQEKFKYILVDEFQDTNYSQFALVKLLALKNRNITVVGDDDQSIYKFRGACLSNILGFTDTYPDCKQIVLRQNYRSTQGILNCAYKLITQNNPERLEVKNKINKELVSGRLEGPAVEHLYFDTLSTEADEVAKRIKQKVEQGKYSWKDFAILVRANNSADPFLKSLNYFNIPWKFSGQQGLYRQPEIRLLLSFLRLMANPNDSLSLHYFSSSKLYDFDPVELSVVNHTASYYGRSIMDVLRNPAPYKELSTLSDKTKKEIKKLLSGLDEYYKIAQNSKTGELLYKFLKRTKILDRLYNSTSNEEVEQAQNIAKFFKIIERYGNIVAYDRVNNFVDYIDSLLFVGDDPTVEEPDFDVDAVNVLTIHKAKGLEFAVVYMVSLVEERFPSRNKSDPIGIPDELIKDILPQGDFHLQEERRLFYVGMTRAKDELYLTSARDYGGKRAKKVSRFVIEALDKPKADEEVFKSSIKEQLERFAPLEKKPDLYKILPKDEGMLKLSPYAIDDYLTCPLKYKYVHVLKVPILRHHTLIYGEVIHKVLKEYYKARKEGRKFTKEDLLALYDKFWSSAGFLSREHEEERLRNGREMLINYFLVEEKRKAVPLSVEEDFKFLLDGNVKVLGRWDRLDKRVEDGKETRVIVDFKTTARVKDQKAADKEIKQSNQLLIYALGHKMKYGVLPDFVELHFLEPNIVSQLKPDDAMINEVKEQIQTAASGISKQEFEANPSYMACQYCAYSNICPKQENT